MTAPQFTSAELIAMLCDQLGDVGVAQSEKQAIEHIRLLEKLKAAAGALQARETMVLEQYRFNAEALAEVPKHRWGKGLAAEVGLARGQSTSRGHKALNIARALLTDLPFTYAALQSGRISEEAAGIMTTETSWLSSEHRRAVDALMADRFDAGLGPRKLGNEVAAHAQRLDQHGAVERMKIAVTNRGVSMRPAADGMTLLYLSSRL